MKELLHMDELKPKHILIITPLFLLAIIAFFGRTPHVHAWHDKQLQTHWTQCTHQRGLYERSIFNLMHVYNRLPQEVVDIDSVSNFQACLIAMAKRKCDAGAINWRQIFRTPLAYVLS